MDIAFPHVHPRVGLLVKTTDPAESPVRPADTFRPSAYGVLVSWPRAYDGWLRVEAEADTGTAVTRFSSVPADLQAAITKHLAERLPLAQQVLTDAWVYANGFLIGSVAAPVDIRLTFRLDTNHEGFVRFLEDPDGSDKAVVLTVVCFDGSVAQPDAQEVRLLLRPATPVPAATALLGLDLGNTCTTAALLDPLGRDGKGLAGPTAQIPMLTARAVPGYRLGSVGVTDPNGHPIASELRFDLFRTYTTPGAEVPISRRFPDLENYSDDRPNAVDYVAGDLARAPGVAARSVVLGAKRMACLRPAPGGPKPVYPTHPVVARHRVVYDPPPSDAPRPVDAPAVMEVDTQAPLELLACRVFQHFREAQLGWPTKVALTYPTTYSRSEFQALRRAVQRGWLRMQAAGQGGPGYYAAAADRELADLVRRLQEVVRGPLDLNTQAQDPVVQLLVDEASAAAFFHLYRRIFEGIVGGPGGFREGSVGGLNRFRYVHEHGLNMLLYDCGGGTTDIALVHAAVEADARTLRVNVLRRSGVRTFGGDNITRQVCRLVKAKIANALMTFRKRKGADQPKSLTKPPVDDRAWRAAADDLERFIRETAALDPKDELVPTRFDAGQTPVEPRRAAALALWRLGEQLKHQLSANDRPPGMPKERNFTPGEVPLPTWAWSKETSALTRGILDGDPEQVTQLKRALETVSVTRVEVDALIYEPVMRSIANCNKLIQSVLEPGDGPTQEVHWVVASGNAVKYPLLQRLLKDRLAVPFLAGDPQKDDRPGEPSDPGRFTFDPENAKDATAKGAVLALAAMESQAQQIDLRFDSSLYNLLPFNVGYRDLTVGAVKVLYPEHTSYDKLKSMGEVIIPLREVTAGEVVPRVFTLVRQFPGDEEFHDFLAFHFPEGGIKGKQLRVRYNDEDPYEFEVMDGETKGQPVDLTAGDVYVAPAQRGDI